MKRIESGAFCDCEYLKSIELPASLEVIESNCFKASGLESVRLNGLVSRINPNAFEKCECLRMIELGEGVQTLAEGWFPHT